MWYGVGSAAGEQRSESTSALQASPEGRQWHRDGQPVHQAQVYCRTGQLTLLNLPSSLGWLCVPLLGPKPLSLILS